VLIGRIRMLPIENFASFILLVKDTYKKFSVFSILAEFGVTIITLGYSLTLFPATKAFQLGTNYLVSFFTIFPNILGIFDDLITKTIYVFNWPLNIRQYLGGSYLGELYYSFGDLSFIFIVFLGMMIAFVSNKIHNAIEEKRYALLSIYLVLFPNMLWWIRNYFVDMVREFVWTSVIIIFLYKVFDSKITKTGNEVKKSAT